MNRMPAFLAVAMLICGPAAAQMSITTIGATDAAACYQNANNQFTSDTAPCDRAIRDGNTTRKDLVKTLINRGIIYNRENDVQAALGDFNRALSIRDDVAEAYLNRGNSWYRAGDFDSAISDYEMSLTLGVSKPWAAWYNIGLVHAARKEDEKARAAYEKALELNPDFTLAKKKLSK